MIHIKKKKSAKPTKKSAQSQSTVVTPTLSKSKIDTPSIFSNELPLCKCSNLLILHPFNAFATCFC